MQPIIDLARGDSMFSTFHGYPQASNKGLCDIERV